jgi:hypothetical protein
MAFVVPTKRGEFEIRESRSSPKGPRSRTLATFRELSDEVIEKARAKAVKPPDPEDLRDAARRSGATVAPRPVDRAARELIAELAKGRRLDPSLRRLVTDLLERENGAGGRKPATDAERSAAEWMASTPRERGNALFDLLLLADALPHGQRVGKPLGFPPLDSTAEAKEDD